MVAKSVLNQKQKHSAQQDKKSSHDLLLEYCKDIDRWAEGWEIGKADRKVGQAIVEQFKLFLLSRIEKGRAKKTIKVDASYLGALGGELIRQLHEENTGWRLSAKNLILKHVSELGGPYWRHAYNDADRDRYDSVCRQLYKFITLDSR